MGIPVNSLHRDLRAIVNEILDDAGLPPVSDLKPSLRLREDLGFDSLKLAILAVRLEDKFNIDVFSTGLVSTIGEVVARLLTQAT